MKADLHVHTCYSGDSRSSLEAIVARCLKVGLDCVAIADHNTIEGALRLRDMAPPFKVIVAEEIRTRSGEVMGLFLEEAVPRGLSAEESIARVRAQGGLVNLPHPCESLSRSSALSRVMLPAVLPLVDAIEVFNARSLLPWDTARARRLARQNGLPGSAGSDAHFPWEIGRAYVEMPDFSGPQDFLQALAQGKVVGRRSGPLVHAFTTWTKLTSWMGR